ncbi:UPF0182 family protein [Solihabitans fulvus]
MRPPVGLPKLSRRSRILLIIGVVLLVGLIAGTRLLDTYVNWLWFGEVGYRQVYGSVLLTRLVLFFAVGAVVGGLVALNLVIAYRTRPVFVPVSGPEDPVARYRSVVVRRMKLFGIGLPVLVGLIVGAAAQNDWQVVQLFLHGTSFGTTDPVFHNDIGFYAFKLPFYTWLLGWLFIAIALSFFGAMVAHYLFGGIRLAGRGGQLSGPARTHLALVAGTFVLFKAVAYFFDRYTLLSSSRSDRFNGATYTDLNAVLPAKLILLCIAVFCAAAFFAGAFMRNLQLPAIATVLLVVSSILVGAAWPAVLEQFSVRPNANEKEHDPIQSNIAATKQAYGLTDDKVETKNYPGKTDLSLSEVKADQPTIGNIRLMDPNVLTKTFTQFQQRKNIYGFPPKLSVDRYQVNGQVKDYIVAIRELNTDGLADNQKDWINRHLTYTHGNGFVAAEASKVDSPADSNGGGGGYPVFTVSDLNNKGEVNQGDIKVTEPRAYYGALATDYAIVGGRGPNVAGEYDTEATQYTYNGKGGVPIGNWFNRLVFAASYGERNILFNQAIGPDTKIMFKRDPRERVQEVAPWLTVDTDPYPAVVDGKMQWIVDGYTTLENYPYAQRTSLGQATNDTLALQTRQPDKTISYIRNSVKATVDAYDGTVTLYSVDDKDPVLKAWMGVFPNSVKPASAVSDALRKHFRYPEDLFKVQREMLAKYHVSNPADFYSGQSFWDVPSDPTAEGAIAAQQQGQSSQVSTQPQQPPYYVLAGDPTVGTGKVDFQLTSALVSLRREFMSAYVTVRSDPDDYGKISVLTLPTETQTKGPQQVQTQFLSSSQVSTDINLLSQQKTKVVYGNLLTLPVGGGLLYVEPVYVERSSQNTSFPQLSKVLVSFGGRVGYASTLADALEQVFGSGAGQTTQPGQNGQNTGTQTPSNSSSPPSSSTGASPPSSVSPDLAKAVDDIQAALQRVKAAQASGDFAALGQAYKDLNDAANRFEQAKAAKPSTSNSPPSSVVQSPTPTG